jgi:hypothetical protein
VPQETLEQYLTGLARGAQAAIARGREEARSYLRRSLFWLVFGIVLLAESFFIPHTATWGWIQGANLLLLGLGSFLRGNEQAFDRRLEQSTAAVRANLLERGLLQLAYAPDALERLPSLSRRSWWSNLLTPRPVRELSSLRERLTALCENYAACCADLGLINLPYRRAVRWADTGLTVLVILLFLASLFHFPLLWLQIPMVLTVGALYALRLYGRGLAAAGQGGLEAQVVALVVAEAVLGELPAAEPPPRALDKHRVPLADASHELRRRNRPLAEKSSEPIWH